MTVYIDRTGEPDDVFEREVLARVEPPAETQTYRVHIGGGRCTSGQECVELDHSVVGVAVPAEPQQDDERARIAEEVASRYFERGDDELGQLRTDVYAALIGDFAQPSADTETLRVITKLILAWGAEMPFQFWVRAREVLDIPRGVEMGVQACEAMERLWAQQDAR